MKHLTLIFILFIILCFNLFSQDPITCNESFLDSDWQISGPIEDDSYSNMGRIVSIWVAPTNPNYILVGTRTSGLWKSIDGGENWSNLTAFQLPACGVLGIAVYDNNTIDYADDIIYLGTEFNGSEMNVYSVGIAYSNDNGINWQYDYSMDSDADLYYCTRRSN